jgi:hypothetical protein
MKYISWQELRQKRTHYFFQMDKAARRRRSFFPDPCNPPLHLLPFSAGRKILNWLRTSCWQQVKFGYCLATNP